MRNERQARELHMERKEERMNKLQLTGPEPATSRSVLLTLWQLSHSLRQHPLIKGAMDQWMLAATMAASIVL